MNLNNKKALLIGINEYQYFSNLSGTGNDIKIMNDVLINKLGFKEEDIKTLIDKEASRDGIIAAMKDLLERVKRDDVVVIHYSGHGSQRPDMTGLEADRLEEIIVPYDSSHSEPHPNRDIGCHEIYAWLYHLTKITQRVTLIFDCCHSGTITRELGRSVEADKRSQTLLEFPWIKDLPKNNGRSVEADKRSQTLLEFPWTIKDNELPKKGESGWLPVSQTYTLIAACRSNEFAHEFKVREARNQRSYGVLTYFLVQNLRKAESCNTYRDVLERAALDIMKRFPEQHPQLEGAGDRILFHLEELHPMRHLVVQKRKGNNHIELNGGTVHGVIHGSIWRIYPQGTKTTKESECLGEVQVTTVRGIHSTAQVIYENTSVADAIQSGNRAVEHRLPKELAQMNVAVEILPSPNNELNELITHWATELVHHIDDSPYLHLITDKDKADVTAFVFEPSERLKGNVPVLSSLSAFDKPVCAVVNKRNTLVSPFHQIDEPHVLTDTMNNLEHKVRYQRVMALKNTIPNFLENKVELCLKRLTADGQWVNAEPEEPNSEVIFQDGEAYGFEIVNHYEQQIFPYVVELGVAGGIDLIYPPMEGSWEPLAPNHTVFFGDRLGEEIEFYIPEKFPFDNPGVRPVEGLETFILIITMENTDLRPLFQGSFRDLPRSVQSEIADSNLGSLLLNIFDDNFREPRSRSSTNNTWTTRQFSVLLQRR